MQAILYSSHQFLLRVHCLRSQRVKAKSTEWQRHCFAQKCGKTIGFTVFSLQNVEKTSGFTVFSLQNVEKPVVLLCFRSKMFKKTMVLLCFRSKRLKKHWSADCSLGSSRSAHQRRVLDAARGPGACYCSAGDVWKGAGAWVGSYFVFSARDELRIHPLLGQCRRSFTVPTNSCYTMLKVLVGFEGHKWHSASQAPRCAWPELPKSPSPRNSKMWKNHWFYCVFAQKC